MEVNEANEKLDSIKIEHYLLLIAVNFWINDKIMNSNFTNADCAKQIWGVLSLGMINLQIEMYLLYFYELVIHIITDLT